jgi:hypothetical protein
LLFNVRTRGVRQVTVWLGAGMTIDFEKPVSVTLNQRTIMNKRKVTPSLGVLLEDFYQRGDRQRLFFVKLDFTVKE